MKNYGLIEGRRDTDFLAGSLSFEERNPSGDWTPFLPPGEYQANHNADTMACVSFSALNSIETQLKFLTGTSPEFSDRFTAKMSGTTSQGNYLYKVADSIRKDGIVLESEYPAPQNFTWETYYSDIPADVKSKAKVYKVAYEWIDVTKDSLIHHLKHAPIQVTIPGHAVLGFFSNKQVNKYFDSYAPFQKDRTESFVSALKIVLTIDDMLTKEQVAQLQALEGYKDQQGVDYWGDGTKTLQQYLDARIPDKIQTLQNV